jgi:hypothetical protein
MSEKEELIASKIFDIVTSKCLYVNKSILPIINESSVDTRIVSLVYHTSYIHYAIEHISNSIINFINDLRSDKYYFNFHEIYCNLFNDVSYNQDEVKILFSYSIDKKEVYEHDTFTVQEYLDELNRRNKNIKLIIDSYQLIGDFTYSTEEMERIEFDLKKLVEDITEEEIDDIIDRIYSKK